MVTIYFSKKRLISLFGGDVRFSLLLSHALRNQGVISGGFVTQLIQSYIFDLKPPLRFVFQDIDIFFNSELAESKFITCLNKLQLSCRPEPLRRNPNNVQGYLPVFKSLEYLVSCDYRTYKVNTIICPNGILKQIQEFDFSCVTGSLFAETKTDFKIMISPEAFDDIKSMRLRRNSACPVQSTSKRLGRFQKYINKGFKILTEEELMEYIPHFSENEYTLNGALNIVLYSNSPDSVKSLADVYLKLIRFK